jgi:hypothetical protein
MTTLIQNSQYIKDIITNSTEPFFIGRIAGIELKIAQIIETHIKSTYNPIDIIGKSNLLELENNAGIKITSPESLIKYTTSLINAYDSCTIIAEWPKDGQVFVATGMGQQLISSRLPKTPKISALALEPYYFDDLNSWMPALTGKRILIIHPFAKTLQKQIPHFDRLFPGRIWFKDCEFQFIQPPLTLAGNHEDRDWETHYTAFISSPAFKELKDFDVALIAAGGYGMLISNHIYTTLKKSVMYIGGALQIFFGVIGKRWFNNRDILNLTNDDWIRPIKEDKPPNFVKVERGCYW